MQHWFSRAAKWQGESERPRHRMAPALGLQAARPAIPHRLPCRPPSCVVVSTQHIAHPQARAHEFHGTNADKFEAHGVP